MLPFEQIYIPFTNHLRERGPMVYHLMMGAACELWAMSELCACMNAATPAILPDGATLVNESTKRDVVLWQAESDRHRVLMAIEAKVVYPNKNLSMCLETLRGQLIRPAASDEIPQMPHVGLVLAIWDSYCESNRWHHAQQFFDCVTGEMRKIFDPPAFRPRTTAMIETVLPQTMIRRCGSNRTVALAAGYLERLQ